MSERPLEPVPERRLPRLLAPVLKELGEADRARISRLLPLFHDGRARLSDCLREAFPDTAGDRALTAFRKLRQNFNDAAEEAGIVFTVDTQLKTPPERRFCWFEAEPTTDEELRNFVD